jgi:hypothetical protein
MDGGSSISDDGKPKDEREITGCRRRQVLMRRIARFTEMISNVISL